MTAFPIRRPSRRPFVVVIAVLAIAIGTQVASAWNGDQAGRDEPLLAAPPAADPDPDAGAAGAIPVPTHAASVGLAIGAPVAPVAGASDSPAAPAQCTTSDARPATHPQSNR